MELLCYIHNATDAVPLTDGYKRKHFVEYIPVKWVNKD